MLSFFFVMTFIAGCIYAFNMLFTSNQILENMEYIASNDGVLPLTYEIYSTQHDIEQGDKNNSDDNLLHQLQEVFGATGEYKSNEFYYSARYFAVLYDEDEQTVDEVITSHIAEIDSESAVEYANKVKDRWFDFGNYGKYYYLVSDRSSGGTIVVVMDCSTQIGINRRLVILACILIGVGMLASVFVIRIWAGKIVQPEIRNAELQKSFITNASHELKTPLAVIKANTEMLEMMGTENEWTKSTMRQVDRLTGLIQNLVLVTRANERDSKDERTYTDFSTIVEETVKTYETVAIQDAKTLESDIGNNIGMDAHEGDIRQITTLLLDNAIKYCDSKGKVTVNLATEKKSIVLTVSNDYKDGEGIDYERFFDRFYRGDESHNIDKEGYGVGLSIAQGLMERYHGEIKADWADGVISFICRF